MSVTAFSVAAYGVDDLTIGFDMTGSRSLRRLNEMAGLESRRGKMLGGRASWGAFAHLFGRSVSFWRSETRRLYVQAKLAPEGELCSPIELRLAVERLLERMAIVGVVSYEPAWVTRLDVAVDAHCRPEVGKLLLDALEGCRPPNGWRTRSVGVPRSTVYFAARASEDVKARAYCRNLKLKVGEPFGLIRLEAEQRYEPKECMLETVLDPVFPSVIWKSRYGGLSSSVTRLGREVQVGEIAERVSTGELTYAQGERLSMFLDLERLGLAASYYPKSVGAARRREAAKLGYAANESPLAVDVDLDDLLRPYVQTVEEFGTVSVRSQDGTGEGQSRASGTASPGPMTTSELDGSARRGQEVLEGGFPGL